MRAHWEIMSDELSPVEIEDLLRAQVVGRIGCHAGGLTYVVPVIYAYAADGLYVASVEGQKTRMLRESPRMCFEVDEYDRAGSWRSAIVQGDYEELVGADAERALTLLAERFGRVGEEGSSRRRHDADGAGTVCFRIRIREVTGRAVRR
jgi:nitroimidazol reductase NimA-like FMN-containing flavoprotein (pyridoxamine 5'-phosphate oxidase superfamily)